MFYLILGFMKSLGLCNLKKKPYKNNESILNKIIKYKLLTENCLAQKCYIHVI